MPPLTANNRPWWILSAMSGVLGLVVLDETIVGVALATIRQEFAMGDVASHWIVNAYFLTFTCFVAVGGRLGDMLGRKPILILGIAIFFLGSLAAGFAPSGNSLIAARAFQGLGAALSFPNSFAILTSAFSPERRGRALGIQTTIAGIFMASGPFLGGLLSETISWRWIFWINLPLLAAIALFAHKALPSASSPSSNAPGGETQRLDGRGLVTLIIGLSGIVIGSMQSGDWGWLAPGTLLPLAIGITFIALFVVTERRTTSPLIHLDLLKIRTFSGAVIVFFMFQFNKIVVFVFLPLFLQHVLQKSPIDAGSALLVAILPTLGTSILSGRLADSMGTRLPLMAGLLLSGTSLIVIAFLTTFESYSLLIPPLVVWGATMPFLAVPPRRALMSAVPPEKRGQASGVNLTIQLLGGTMAIAICGTILAITGFYGPIFLLTGLAMLSMILVTYAMIEQSG